MKKRITAALLSFILLMNCSVTALATERESAPQKENATAKTMYETEISQETELSEESEVPQETESQDVAETGESEAGTGEAVIETKEPETEAEEFETTTEETGTEETETAIEETETAIEETETAGEDSPLLTDRETVDMLQDDRIAQRDLLVQEAKTALQQVAGEKPIYALVYLTDSYAVRETPSKESDAVAVIPSAHTVQILDVEIEREKNGDSEKELTTMWYYVQFYVGDTLKKGYIEDEYLAYSDELLLEWKNQYQALFYNELYDSSINASYETYAAVSYKDVNEFPVSYQVYLRRLKESHPNWTFVKMDVGRKWEDCVKEQQGNYSWIYYNQPANFRGGQINSTWYYASKEGIAYYMDPRNFLTDSYIFQFEQNTYNASYHTQEALQAFLANTFMKGKVPDDSKGRTYAKVIYDSGKNRNLSPFNLSARVIQEQGIHGNSAMISGTYSGFEGYYNHYNISASGTTNAEVIRNGLAYAKEKGWNTRVKSLEGGAEFIGNGYILQGQDTLYLQKFDVMHGSSSLHQYMQNIMAPYSEGISMRTMYSNAGALDSKFVFKIPVFEDMPAVGYSMETSSPVKLKKGKTKQISIKCDGVQLSDLTVFKFVSDNPEIATVSTTGKITAVGTGEDYSGKTTIRVTLKEDSNISFNLKVVVTNPLESISLETEDDNLYFLTDEMPDKIPYNDNGVTKYKKKSDCKTETVISVVYNPSDTTDDRSVKWTVEDENIVSLEALDTNGSKIKLTAKTGGTTLVSAKVGDCKATTRITVREPMTDAWLRENEITLYKGQRTQILTAYTPYNTTDTVEPEWISSDESVVKIENGEIVAVGKGTAVVQASVGPFAFEGITEALKEKLSCIVTVEEYTVTFMNEDDSVHTSVTGRYGSILADLETETEGVQEQGIPWTLTKEDFVFIGWYTDKNGAGNPVTKDTVLYESMILYPYFVSVNTDFHIKPIGSVVYTGGYLRPSVTVYAGEEQLVRGTHYTLSYVNNRDVYDASPDKEPPKVIVVGRGKYAGYAAQETFLIVPKNIADMDVTSSNVTVAYDGKLHKIQPFVKDAGRFLQNNTDYELVYTAAIKGDGTPDLNAYKQPGTYPIEIIGKGNYIGKRKVYVTITKRVSVNELTVSEIKDVTYNDGEPFESPEKVKAWKPEPVVTYRNQTLIKDVDYELSPSNNIEIGIAKVTITGKGNYIGTRDVHFRITGTDISTVTVSGVTDIEYTSREVIPDSLVLRNKNNRVLKEGLDYTLTYENNTEVGKAYAVINGINGYTGSRKVLFNIKPYDISNNLQTYQTLEGEVKPAFEVVCEEMAEYEKAGAKPSVKAYFKGKELVEGREYKVTYKNNHQISGTDNVRKPTVVITGKGAFTGTFEKEFLISKRDISSVSIRVKDVKFRNRKEFCFAVPVLSDVSKRRLTAGKDYSEKYVYTYASDVVLYDGTVRLLGDKVEEGDIPTPGELEDARIKVTVTGTGNYTGEISATYRILKNTSWFEDWVEDEPLKLKVSRTQMYLSSVYPEGGDTIRLEASDGMLSEDKTVITCDREEVSSLFEIVLHEGRLTISLTGSKDEPEGMAGAYTFTVAPIAVVDGKEVVLPHRTLYVNVSDEKPEVDFAVNGNIDLLYRDTTAFMLRMKMAPGPDAFVVPKTEDERKDAYVLSGTDGGSYLIDYDDSIFADNEVLLCMRASQDAETLSPDIPSSLELQYQTERGIRLSQKFDVTPKQTDYKLIPKTEKCYIKMSEGKGQILFVSTPSDIEYKTVTCEDERIAVSMTGSILTFAPKDITKFSNGEELELNIAAYAKDAGKDTAPSLFTVTLVFCEETELDKLIAAKDTESKTLEQRQQVMTSYQETGKINEYDKKVIAANTIDFSDCKLAFLGDSITEGVGLENIGVEENVYTSVVKRALNPKEVCRFGYGGFGMSYLGDSLLEKYRNIPSDTDIIFVFAGINDVYDGSEAEFGSLTNLSRGTFCGDTYELMTSLKTHYPDAQIIFLTPLSSITNTWYKETLPDMLPMKRYVNAINALGKMADVTVWDLYNENLLDSYDEKVLSKYMRDGVHPGVAGHRILGEHIASELIRMKMEK